MKQLAQFDDLGVEGEGVHRCPRTQAVELAAKPIMLKRYAYFLGVVVAANRQIAGIRRQQLIVKTPGAQKLELYGVDLHGTHPCVASRRSPPDRCGGAVKVQLFCECNFFGAPLSV